MEKNQLDFVGYETIPHFTKDALDRWVNHGIYPGGFLTAVLCNDLFRAMGNADSHNLKELHNIVLFIYNRTPAGSWGSAAIMREWSASKALNV